MILLNIVRLRKSIVIILIVVAGLIGVIVFDLSRPTSKIRIFRLNYFTANNLNDEQIIMERERELRKQEEIEEQNLQLSSMGGVFQSLEGNKIHFRLAKEVEIGNSIYRNFEDKIGVINEDSTFFKMTLAPQDSAGVVNVAITPAEIKESDEIIIYTFPGGNLLDEIPIQSLYVTY